ncbi:MAG: type II secretion system F family protein [Candidatus Riflebacteria bacterium]|nr:type II secretion system F family protein [Candidatus Riflebacteria bacterium]
MPLFFGKAGDLGGITRPFTMDARSREELDRQLGRLGLFPIEVQEISRGVFSVAFWSNLFEGRVPTRSLIGFTRSLAVLLDSGIPILEALGTVTLRENDPDAREVYAAVGRQLEGGQDLHEALSRHTDVFPAHYVHSVQVGERSASLPAVLERLATDLETQEDLTGRFLQAMIYPAMLALATIALFVLSVVFVLPRFLELYSQMGVSPPQFTSTLMAAVDFVWQNSLLLILLVSLMVYRVYLLASTVDGRALLESFVLGVPMLGQQIRAYRLGSVARNLALMKESGMPLPEALEVLSRGEPSPAMARALELARRYLEFGNSPSTAFEGARLMDADAIRMVRAGEETDKLGMAFRRIATENERLMAHLADRIAALVPPILLVVAGVVVVAMVSATLIPMMEMIKNL